MNRCWIYAVRLVCQALVFSQTMSAQRVNLRTDAVTAGLHTGLVSPPGFNVGLDLWTPYGLFTGRAIRVLDTFTLIPKHRPIEKNVEFGLLYGWKANWCANVDSLDVRHHTHGLDMALSIAVGIASVSLIRRGQQTGSQEDGFHNYIFFYIGRARRATVR